MSITYCLIKLYTLFFQSTGDSLDEDDEKLSETKKNTSQNEVIDADNPQTPVEVVGID